MRYAESVLAAHLTNADSLDILAREGFLSERSLDVIPTELLRTLITWSLARFFESGRKVAPSKQAIIESFGNKMEALGLVIEDDVETDTVQWAIADLRSFHLHLKASEWAQVFATDLYDAEPERRIGVAQDHSAVLERLIQTARPRRNEMTGIEGVEDAIFRLRERQLLGEQTMGLTFGMQLLDEHLFGVHPGEICTVAGGPGTGKSWLAGWVTNHEFQRGRKPLLVTLENDAFMTFDRLVCMAAGIDYEDWQRGRVHEGQMIIVEDYRRRMSESRNQPSVVQLSPEESTPTAIVRRAAMEDADSLIVDQLSFVRPDAGSRAVKRNEQLADIMRSFATLIKHEYSIPLVLLSQISREGVGAARKTGRYFKEHLAEGSWIEQSSDVVLALFQSDIMAEMEHAQIQQLKGRRTGLKHFDAIWRPYVGDVRLLREVALSETPEADKKAVA